MKKINLLLLPVIAVALLQACSGTKVTTDADSATSQTDTNQSASTQVAAADTAFANKAAISSMAEVALGQMAASKAVSADVKGFGNMMVKDHEAANRELIGIAQRKNLALPKGLDAEHRAKSDSLSRLSGAEFDRAYVKAMVEAHQKVLALMNAEATGGQDADLKGFAGRTAPVIQHHLEEATKLQSTIK